MPVKPGWSFSTAPLNSQKARSPSSIRVSNAVLPDVELDEVLEDDELLDDDELLEEDELDDDELEDELDDELEELDEPALPPHPTRFKSNTTGTTNFQFILFSQSSRDARIR